MSTTQSRFVYALMILILLFGFFLRTFVLNDIEINHDELFDYERTISRWPIWQIPIVAYRIGSHSLADVWAKACYYLLGDTPFSLRWASLCMSVLGIVLIFKIAVQLFGKQTGLAAAFLLAVSPYALFYTYDFRAYAGMLFYAMLACYLTMRAMAAQKTWYWIASAAAWAVAVYNHFYAALAWPGLILITLIYYRHPPCARLCPPSGGKDRGLPQLRQKQALWQYVRAPVLISLAGVLAAIVIPLVPVGVRSVLDAAGEIPPDLTDFYVPSAPSEPGTVISTLAWFNGVNLDRMPYAEPKAFYLTVALAGVAIVLGILQRPPCGNRACPELAEGGLPQSTKVFFLLAWLLLPFAALFVGHLLTPQLMSRERYFGFVLPPFLLLVALAPTQLWYLLKRWLPVGQHACVPSGKTHYLIVSVTVLAIVAIWAQPLRAIYQTRTTGNWVEVASYLAPRVEGRDLVLCELYGRSQTGAKQRLSETCPRNLSYWVKAKDMQLVYPVLSLDQASNYQYLASNLQTANRFGRVWLVVFDVPSQVNFQALGIADLREWNRFGRTVLLPPPENATLLRAMMVHLEHLASLPHGPQSLFGYHLSLAQLASIQGLTEVTRREWQAAESLLPQVPEAAALIESARKNLDNPPLLQSPVNPAESFLGDVIRFDGFTLSPGQTIRPQDAVNLTLFWHATASPPDDYTVFVHIRDAEGKVVFQDDFTPSPNTRGWWPGDSIWQTRTLSVPADTGTGEYRIYSGMYLLSTMERLPVKGGNASSDNAIYLTSLWVKR